MDGDEEHRADDTNRDYELQILEKIKDMSDFGLTNINSTENKIEKSKQKVLKVNYLKFHSCKNEF